ncbi:hypothetical protein ASG29_03885 [Sphingomonas sp. Leaf412]|uniref:hypothetical protein n=1 Tax=Sphingomonas sp. Leaf412 TaxID=1736370 RepID=UPI0006FC0138|nr:hypothetical protein [Sphingomonas sp. Leaf412]KQT35256.1 hypothetical protein ASG29_03885 [Sphingomonas sp. Leaf412]
MAYVDFSIDPLLVHDRAPRHDDVDAAPAGLSALEWSVVALARRDRLSSLSRPGAVSIALGAVFGGRRHSPHLADPRLEALRRMAVLSWHRGRAVSADELAAFLDAGFSPAQYRALLTSIAAARSRRGMHA